MAYSPDTTHFKIPSLTQALLVIFLCAAFFFYKYILQNFPSVMTPELMQAFHLQGVGLGVLSGAYFWTYLIVPLMVGVVLDRFGMRWITTFAIICCALGLYIFAKTNQLETAIAGRVLMGIGVSFATITYFKAASIWFHAKYYPLLTSFLVTIGMIGAVCGQVPLAWLIHQSGWRASLTHISWAGLVLAALFALLVVDKKAPVIETIGQEPRSLWQDILLIIKNKQNWLLTAYGGLAFAPIVIFCGLWGNPFLQKAYQLDKLTAPTFTSLVFIGLAMGSPLFASLMNQIKNRISCMFYTTLLSALSISLIIYAHPMPLWILGGLLFLFGFSLGAFPMVFVIGKEINPLYLAGTAISLINASDAFFDAITEPLIGKLLDALKDTNSNEFSLAGYHIALSILPLYQIIGACLLKKVADKH